MESQRFENLDKLEENKKPSIHVFGYGYRDHHCSLNLRDFLDEYGNQSFLNINSKKQRFKDLVNKKVSVDKKEDTNLREFIKNELIPKGLIIKSVPGGGGRNSREALDELGIGGEYFDTCSCLNPNEDLNLLGSTYFAGISDICDSLILEDLAGSSALKTNRNDNLEDHNLDTDAKRKLLELANSGAPLLVNSFSHYGTIDLLVNEGNGRIYSVITKSLPKNSAYLNKLLHHSELLFFSGKEFYYHFGDEGKYDILSNGEFNRDKSRAMMGDIQQFVKGLGIKCPIIVTLGSNGALVYSNEGVQSETNHVVLNDKKRTDIQEYLVKNRGTTNTSGDTFEAITTHSYTNYPGNTLTFAFKKGCEGVVKKVIGYNDVSSVDYKTIEI